ncbi:cobalamin biosynthesis protein [Actinoplanes sichuanensis]|uniref:Cobalamin biosynthesis protein n=1 Tax=Actinoplanes sichuanensis TaxID=512349 RepID=A0ABW4AIA3_9ACTN|nr:cobalamin biosynthesis protein [Actinoplanes sichuanensis]BEL02308.1 cobalamin biosynthesis protein [Actinoplanes sichuanensis]
MIALGLGARSGVPLRAPVLAALAAAGIGPAMVTVLATLDRRAAEHRFQELATGFGWRLSAFTAAELAACPVPNPSLRTAAATGAPSVAEAAALLAAGPGAVLIRPKTARDGVTVALAGQPFAAPGHS